MTGFIIALDMNCNMYNTSHPYSAVLNDLINRCDLVNAFELNPLFDRSSSWTRSGVSGRNKVESRTLIDGILISKSLSGNVSNVRIDHNGSNLC